MQEDEFNSKEAHFMWLPCNSSNSKQYKQKVVVLKCIQKLPSYNQLPLEERKAKKALGLTLEIKALESTSKI